MDGENSLKNSYSNEWVPCLSPLAAVPTAPGAPQMDVGCSDWLTWMKNDCKLASWKLSRITQL